MKNIQSSIILAIFVAVVALGWVFSGATNIQYGAEGKLLAAIITATTDKVRPSAPTALRATGESGVVLEWVGSTDNVGVVGYQILRAGVQIATSPTPSFTDTTGVVNKLYAYKVQAFDASGNISIPSNTVIAKASTVSAVDTTSPSAPTNLSVSLSQAKATLAWSASTDNVGVRTYTVYRNGIEVGSVTTTTYTDTTITLGVSYQYSVKAVDDAGNVSPESNIANTVSVDTARPTAPSGLVALNGAGVVLTWSGSTDNIGVLGYEILRANVGIATTSGTTFTDTTGTINKSYAYKVRAFDVAGNVSTVSNTVIAKALTIATTPKNIWDCVVIAPPASYHLDSFYKKFCLAGGIPIVSSGAVPDTAHQAVASMMKSMLEKRPDAIAKLVSGNVRVAIIGQHEVTTDIPEYHDLYTLFPGTDWNIRTRGISATALIPVSSVGEENVLCYASDPYHGESIFVHEFAHSFKDLGIAVLDPTFNGQLSTAYASARQHNLWANTYAISNREEYWAEGVQSYFTANLTANPPNGIHNDVNGPAKLLAYDPTLYALIQSAYKTDWQWQCPR